MDFGTELTSQGASKPLGAIFYQYHMSVTFGHF
jgi:hypothetical protein